jgi:3-carboxy-cis,cis-muconate cycloisomerase
MYFPNDPLFDYDPISLRDHIDRKHLKTLFDPAAATAPAHRLAQRQLQSLRGDVAAFVAALNSAHTYHQ